MSVGECQVCQEIPNVSLEAELGEMPGLLGISQCVTSKLRLLCNGSPFHKSLSQTSVRACVRACVCGCGGGGGGGGGGGAPVR